MKILFTADQHITLRKKGVKKDWATNRYKQYFDCLASIDHDIIILGGDFFDKTPSIQEIGLFLDFVSTHPKPMYIIAGNHEATTKYETFLGELDHFPNITFCLEDSAPLDLDGTNIQFMTYDQIKKNENPPKIKEGNNILVSHARGELPFVDPEYDFSKFSEYDLVLLGDLHSMHQEPKFPNTWYPGSPYSITFELGNNDKEWGIFVIETTPFNPIPLFLPLDLPQLIKVECTPEQAGSVLATSKKSKDCILVEVTGNPAELVGVDKSIKRKVKVVSEATVDLVGKNSSDEIKTVLEYMDVKDLPKIMETYHEVT